MNDENDATAVFELVKQLNEDNKKKMDIDGLLKLDEIDENVVKNCARFARA